MVRSILVKLAMLGATLSMIGWMGWNIPSNRGEAGSVGPPAELDLRDTPSAPVVALEAVPQSSRPVEQPMSGASPTLPRRPATVKSLLDVNQATVRELDLLPGIGPAMAQRIIEFRYSNGPFATVDDLLLVKGIGPKKLDRLRELVTVHKETRREGQRERL